MAVPMGWMFLITIEALLIFRTYGNADPTSSEGCGVTKYSTSDCDKNLTNCGGKGCVISSRTCIPGVDCDASLTYTVDHDTPTYISFEAATKFSQSPATPVYIAVGYSTDEIMADDAVTICIYQSDGKGAIGLFYNPSAQYVATINAGIEATNILHDVQISLENNTLICKFKQLINPPLNIQNRVFPLNSKLYHIFLATGQFDSQHNVPFMHDAPPFISPLVNLSTNQTAVADNGDPTTGAMKAHGILMIFGWWIFIVNGMLIARYFKSVMNTEYCGIKLWFYLHCTFNILGLLCIILAFVFIFAVTKARWAGQDGGAVGNHAILGMTAVVCGLLNPLMALVRCKPGTNRRPIFNWAHRTVGILAWCCASAAIFEVTKEPFKFDLNVGSRHGQIPRSLMYAYFVILGLVVLVLEELYASCEGEPSAVPTNVIAVSSPEPAVSTASQVPPKSSKKFGKFRIIALLIFNISAVCISVIEATFIGLAAPPEE